MIDTRGLSCPIPVLMVRKAIEQNGPDTLEVLSDARAAVENITRCARTKGYQVAETAEGADYRLTLTKLP